MAANSKSTGIMIKVESVRVCIESVLSLNKHVWELYQVFNKAIKGRTQGVNGLASYCLDGFWIDGSELIS